MPVVAHSALWAYAKICRLEYIGGEAPAVFIPALLTASNFTSLASPALFEGIAVFALLYVTGFIANALTDRDLDLKYDSFKREIGEATAQLGPGRVKAILVGHLVAALVITLHLSISQHAPVLFALVGLGVFLALAYSLPPLHLKVRGVAAHAVALSLSAFGIPFFFLYTLSAGGVDAHGWAIGAGFTLTHYGLTYTNQAYDFDGDRREGVRTPPVRLGLARALYASAAMVAVGLVLLTFSLVSLALSRDTVAAAWGGGGRIAIAVGGAVLVWLGYSVPLRGLARMRAVAGQYEVEAESVPRIRREVDYAKFHASGIAALAVFGLLLFGATFESQVVLEDEAAGTLHFASVDPALDLTSPGGPSADIALTMRYDGARALPLGVVLVEVEARESAAALPYFVERVPVAAAFGPGEIRSLVIQGVPAHVLGGGCAVTLKLVLDADRDGLALRSADTAVVTLP